EKPPIVAASAIRVNSGGCWPCRSKFPFVLSVARRGELEGQAFRRRSLRSRSLSRACRRAQRERNSLLLRRRIPGFDHHPYGVRIAAGVNLVGQRRGAFRIPVAVIDVPAVLVQCGRQAVGAESQDGRASGGAQATHPPREIGDRHVPAEFRPQHLARVTAGQRLLADAGQDRTIRPSIQLQAFAGEGRAQGELVLLAVLPPAQAAAAAVLAIRSGEAPVETPRWLRTKRLFTCRLRRQLFRGAGFAHRDRRARGQDEGACPDDRPRTQPAQQVIRRSRHGCNFRSTFFNAWLCGSSLRTLPSTSRALSCRPSFQSTSPSCTPMSGSCCWPQARCRYVSAWPRLPRRYCSQPHESMISAAWGLAASALRKRSVASGKSRSVSASVKPSAFIASTLSGFCASTLRKSPSAASVLPALASSMPRS